MSPAGFLLLALGISVVGSLVLWARSHRPGGIDASIDDFRRELAALSPERSPDAVVREQSRLRAEGRWIERTQPSDAATGGDASMIVVHGASWATDGHDGDDEHPAEDHEDLVDDDDLEDEVPHVEHTAYAELDHDDELGEGGGYFDDLYLHDDEER